MNNSPTPPVPKYQKRRKLKLAAFAVGGTFALGFGVLLTFFIYEMALQATLLPEVEARYGGTIVAPYIQANGKHVEPITITDIQPGSAFDTAGLTDDDIIVSHNRIGSLCQDLDQPTGSTITIEVVPGGNGPAIASRPRRTLHLTAP